MLERNLSRTLASKPQNEDYYNYCMLRPGKSLTCIGGVLDADINEVSISLPGLAFCCSLSVTVDSLPFATCFLSFAAVSQGISIMSGNSIVIVSAFMNRVLPFGQDLADAPAAIIIASSDQLNETALKTGLIHY